MEHGTLRPIPCVTGFHRCVTMITQGKSFSPHLRHKFSPLSGTVPARVQPEFSLSRVGMRIGGERVTCRVSKLTNSLGKQQLWTRT